MKKKKERDMNTKRPAGELQTRRLLQVITRFRFKTVDAIRVAD